MGLSKDSLSLIVIISMTSSHCSERTTNLTTLGQIVTKPQQRLRIVPAIFNDN